MIAALLVLLAGCGCVSVPSLDPLQTVSFSIDMKGGDCTGTAVAPHWLVTAAHCVYEGGPVVAVAGKPAKTLDVIFDGSDHVLVRVDYTFSTWARFGTARIGDRVRILGNPVGLRNVYRVGMVSALNNFPWCPDIPGLALKKCSMVLFQIVTGNGDSGAAYFNNADEIVAVHTGTIQIGASGMAYALPLAFTEAQLASLQ